MRSIFAINDRLAFSEESVLAQLQRLEPDKSPDWMVFIQYCSSHVQTNWRSHSVLFIKHPIPSDWKLANVSPIFRKGTKNNHGNYRPVSLTSGPRKIMDGILRDHLLDHLDANHISVTGNTDLCEDGLVPQICWKHSRNGRRP